jgi:hypothetical protein
MSTTITDEYMRKMLSHTRDYCLVLLKPGPNENMEGAEKIIWEHGRRNFSLRADKILSIVCPVSDEGYLAGICIFNATVEETKRIMDGDPCIVAGVLVYEVHRCRGFPADCLPG